jgi:hypothetical protein
MNLSNIISIISVLVAAAALIVSIFADRRSKKLDLLLKQKELEKNEEEENDKKKADVEVNEIDTPEGKLPLLRFYNKGLSEAHNVKFEITSDLENNICLNIREDYLPYPKLLPQQNFDIPYQIYRRKAHQTIVITWDDEYGKDRKKEMVIDM